MGVWTERIEPRLVSLACGAPAIEASRARIVPRATGTVLEIGYGSGRNLPHYRAEAIDGLILLEPSEPMRRLAEARLERSGLPTRILAAGAEAVPLPDDSVDTVVVTYTLCTVSDLEGSLAEARRVLRPGGALHFAEHGLAPGAGVRGWQRRVQPVWGRLAGGCHLTRDVTEALGKAGFALEAVSQGYVPGVPRIAGYVSSGTARAA